MHYNLGFRGQAASNIVATYCLISIKLHKPSKYIHPEDGNCTVCRNVGKPITFDAAYPRKPKIYINIKDKFIFFKFSMNIMPLELSPAS
jgi:hypothetical protein